MRWLLASRRGSSCRGSDPELPAACSNRFAGEVRLASWNCRGLFSSSVDCGGHAAKRKVLSTLGAKADVVVLQEVHGSENEAMVFD